MGTLIAAILIICAIDIVLLTSHADDPRADPILRHGLATAEVIGCGYLEIVPASQFLNADQDIDNVTACRAYPRGDHAKVDTSPGDKAGPGSIEFFSCVIPTSVN